MSEKEIKNLKKRKILFVDDERHFQELLTSMFKEEGFETFSAYDGEEGIKMAEAEKPDIILTDLILPKKNGFFILEEVKKNPHLANIPIIVLTNLEENQNVERILSLGAKMYLVKANYELSEIVEKVKNILNIE